ncbi:4-(cytidine 5'-diphospho)-2-C-methyl-D-erythritol kinase [bacterium]|nr:4-(cytidine 5'-diphospho)-2-C-methyl-D-erythritol kinase [bacterium]
MITIKAYAKINLCLRVLGRRPDGYHELETLFQQIDLCDTLLFSEADQALTVTTSHADCPADEKNIVYRAADLLRRCSGCQSGVHIHIEKHIPMGAGLGGGSSDAAAALMGLNRLWRLNLDDALLHQLASQLGADVAFFLHGGSALGTGRGEQLQPLRLPLDYYGVLVYPRFPISTAWAYQNLKLNLTNSPKRSKFYSFDDLVNDRESWQQGFTNDLEKVVFEEYPELDRLREQLATAGAFFSRMSGSGSCIYGLYETRARAEKAFLGVGTSYQRFLFSPISTHANPAETV